MKMNYYINYSILIKIKNNSKLKDQAAVLLITIKNFQYKLKWE
jgi:hypothetical protein